MDLILFFSAVFIGFLAGEAWAAFKIRKFITKLAKDHGIDLEKEILKEQVQLKPEVSKLYIEHAEGTFLLYEIDTHKFIGQGSSIEELAKISQTQNINKAAVKHDDKWFMFIEGTAKEFKLNV